MIRYVLLEHDPRPRGKRCQSTAGPVASADGAPENSTVHWDLIAYDAIGMRGRTWRLDRNPLAPTKAMPRATAIAAHRAIYWEYEGELTRDRGVVRRVARGVVAAGSGGVCIEALIDEIRRRASAAFPALAPPSERIPGARVVENLARCRYI